MPRGHASAGGGPLPGTGPGLPPAQSHRGAGVSGTFPQQGPGEVAAKTGRAEEFHFSFEPARGGFAASAEWVGAPDCQPLRPSVASAAVATVDQDATIIESHKAAAYWHYAQGRGYQPMVAMWA